MLMAQHAAKKESSYVEYEERCKIRTGNMVRQLHANLLRRNFA